MGGAVSDVFDTIGGAVSDAVDTVGGFVEDTASFVADNPAVLIAAAAPFAIPALAGATATGAAAGAMTAEAALVAEATMATEAAAAVGGSLTAEAALAAATGGTIAEGAAMLATLSPEALTSLTAVTAPLAAEAGTAASTLGLTGPESLGFDYNIGSGTVNSSLGDTFGSNIGSSLGTTEGVFDPFVVDYNLGAGLGAAPETLEALAPFAADYGLGAGAGVPGTLGTASGILGNVSGLTGTAESLGFGAGIGSNLGLNLGDGLWAPGLEDFVVDYSLGPLALGTGSGVLGSSGSLGNINTYGPGSVNLGVNTLGIPQGIGTGLQSLSNILGPGFGGGGGAGGVGGIGGQTGGIYANIMSQIDPFWIYHQDTEIPMMQTAAGQANTLANLYGQSFTDPLSIYNTPQMQALNAQFLNDLERKDAAVGRMSQYGPRAVQAQNQFLTNTLPAYQQSLQQGLGTLYNAAHAPNPNQQVAAAALNDATEAAALQQAAMQGTLTGSLSNLQGSWNQMTQGGNPLNQAIGAVNTATNLGNVYNQGTQAWNTLSNMFSF